MLEDVSASLADFPDEYVFLTKAAAPIGKKAENKWAARLSPYTARSGATHTSARPARLRAHPLLRPPFPVCVRTCARSGQGLRREHYDSPARREQRCQGGRCACPHRPACVRHTHVPAAGHADLRPPRPLPELRLRVHAFVSANPFAELEFGAFGEGAHQHALRPLPSCAREPSRAGRARHATAVQSSLSSAPLPQMRTRGTRCRRRAARRRRRAWAPQSRRCTPGS